jgi:hypothetical protein
MLALSPLGVSPKVHLIRFPQGNRERKARSHNRKIFWKGRSAIIRKRTVKGKNKYENNNSTIFSVMACMPLIATSAWAQTHAGSTNHLTFLGTRPLTSGVSNRALPQGFLISEGLDEDVGFDIRGVSGNNSAARIPAAHVPTPTGNAITTGVFFGIPGLSQFDQAVAFTGSANGSNGQLEPPDQGLAVGNGLVVEAINNAIAIFLTDGTLVLAPLAMNVLYNVAPTFTLDPVTGQVVSFGPFLSDPRVYYDANNGFFFVTETETDRDPTTGALGSASHIFIAVIPNNLSTVSVFSVDVSNDGDAAFGTCPCFGDQPLIAADANGFYISTNAFNTAQRTFRGAQLYAIPLVALEAGVPGSITGVHIGNLTQGGEPGFSLQPATVPPGGGFESGQGGTEYLVSTFHNFLDDRLTVWALTNTSSLNTATPSLNLVNTVIVSESYALPPATTQKSGPTPLRDLIASTQSPFGTFKNHLELVADNDNRLQQVTFAAGKLWTSVPTAVQTQGPVRPGAGWFILTPSIGTGGSAQPSSTRATSQSTHRIRTA